MESAVKRGVKRKPSVELATKLELDSLVKSFNEGLQQLSKNQETLGKNFNQNLNAILGAFQFVDAHQHVSRRILNDMALGRLRMIVNADGTPDSIDYEWYHGEYHKVRFVIRFFEKLRELLGWDDIQKEEDTEQPTEAPVDEFTFGGDYASQDDPTG